MSCLGNGIVANSFISGSWDKTAKYWVLGDAQNSLITYSGHAAAVWSVLQLQNANVVTASADRTIGIWSKEGQRLKTLQGNKGIIFRSYLILTLNFRAYRLCPWCRRFSGNELFR